ncbi:MFS transporter [Delftia sp. PS-11]|uniref:MFS transporter n=1 Tax=Delftia sp. PS-11 TaxID=2767222 RepID=UPI002454047F|nr:MFS transporter [Delftia sp. PS-11]KAJ8745566.1 MFS transporter [Delftia sp. PS-11]
MSLPYPPGRASASASRLAPAAATPSGLGYAYYVAIILLLAYTLSFVDRQILGLLVQPIKKDLQLSDWVFSIVHGFAFAIFYTFVGIFLGRLADRWNRRNLIIIGMAIWVVATAAGGYVTGFVSLFVARMFVGIGEASLSPAAYSMLADYFPPERRARAMSIYTSGVYIGSATAFIVGGLVIQATSQAGEVVFPLLGSFKPWQAAFIFVALPGIPLVALMYTVREPLRRGLAHAAAGKAAQAAAAQPAGPAPDLSYVLRHKRAFVPLLLAPGITAMITFGVTAWLPATFIRQWGWTPGEIGPAYGVIILTFGIGGMLLSGLLADHLTARGKLVGSVVISLAATAVLVLTGLALAFAPSPTVALVAVAATTFFLGMPVALAPPILQAVTPNQLRGQVTSIYLLLINLIGLGMGPFLVAFCTDFVLHDEKSVGLSLGLVSALAAALSVACLASAIGPYRRLVAATSENKA